MRFKGRISRMVPTIDRAKATVMTKVQFEAIDARVLPEMSAKVAFLSRDITPEQQQPLLAVNADALVLRDGKTTVFLVKDGAVATEVPVVTGTKLGDLVAVSGDLRSGDKVVLKPAVDLKSGSLTKPAPK
jgi:multidrug efflux pump subunit AcrA (membrane-fusion protein)